VAQYHNVSFVITSSYHDDNHSKMKNHCSPIYYSESSYKTFYAIFILKNFSHAKKSGFLPLATATRDNLYICGFIKVNTRTIIKNVNKVHKDSNQFHVSTQCEMQGLQTVTMFAKVHSSTDSSTFNI